MKAQSNIYPSVEQYDSQYLAVPTNITEIIKENEIFYEYDMVLVKQGLDKKQQINAVCQVLILDKFSIIHQLDVAHGLYIDNGMKAWIAAMVAESNRCTDLVDTNQPAVPVWPEYVEVV